MLYYQRFGSGMKQNIRQIARIFFYDTLPTRCSLISNNKMLIYLYVLFRVRFSN